MLDKNIYLKDQNGSNNLNAYFLDGGVCIDIFEYECKLSMEDTLKLRDFLTRALHN